MSAIGWLVGNAVMASALAVLVAIVARAGARPGLVRALWIVVLLRLLAPPLGVFELSVGSGWFATRDEAPSDPGDAAPPERAEGASPNRAPAGQPAVGTESDRASLSVVVEQRAPASAAAPETDPAVQLAALRTEASGRGPAAAPSPTPATAGGAMALPASQPDAGLRGASRDVHASIRWWAGLLVLAGSLVILLRGLRDVRDLHRVVGRATEAGPALHRSLEQVSRRLGVRTPFELKTVWTRLSPFLTVRRTRPTIVFPAGLEHRLDEDQRRLVLAHEVAHFRLRDHWVRALEWTCTALFWWCPTLWWARRRLRAVQELCCDGQVLSFYRDREREYARTLLAVSDFVSAESPAAASMAATGSPSSLYRRLEMILSHDLRRRSSVPLRLASVAVAASALLFDLGHAQSSEGDQGDKKLRVVVTKGPDKGEEGQSFRVLRRVAGPAQGQAQGQDTAPERRIVWKTPVSGAKQPGGVWRTEASNGQKPQVIVMRGDDGEVTELRAHRIRVLGDGEESEAQESGQDGDQVRTWVIRTQDGKDVKVEKKIVRKVEGKAQKQAEQKNENRVFRGRVVDSQGRPVEGHVIISVNGFGSEAGAGEYEFDTRDFTGGENTFEVEGGDFTFDFDTRDLAEGANTFTMEGADFRFEGNAEFSFEGEGGHHDGTHQNRRVIVKNSDEGEGRQERRVIVMRSGDGEGGAHHADVDIQSVLAEVHRTLAELHDQDGDHGDHDAHGHAEHGDHDGDHDGDAAPRRMIRVQVDAGDTNSPQQLAESIERAMKNIQIHVDGMDMDGLHEHLAEIHVELEGLDLGEHMQELHEHLQEFDIQVLGGWDESSIDGARIAEQVKAALKEAGLEGGEHGMHSIDLQVDGSKMAEELRRKLKGMDFQVQQGGRQGVTDRQVIRLDGSKFRVEQGEDEGAPRIQLRARRAGGEEAGGAAGEAASEIEAIEARIRELQRELKALKAQKKKKRSLNL